MIRVSGSLCTIRSKVFEDMPAIEDVYIVNYTEQEMKKYDDYDKRYIEAPEGVRVHYGEEPDLSMYFTVSLSIKFKQAAGAVWTVSHLEAYTTSIRLYDKAKAIETITADGESIPFAAQSETFEENGEKHTYITSVMIGNNPGKRIEAIIRCAPSTFKKAEDRNDNASGYLDFYTGNPEYKGTTQEAVHRCTVCCHFDGRLFFTGNPQLPNTIFYTQRDLTGYNNPTYIGMLNYMNDGVGNAPNTAMVATAGTLMVFKSDTSQDGSVYYHTGVDTSNNVVPRIYPSMEGVPGIGCLGAAVNFYDDVCFLSRRGLEAIGKQTVNLERTVEHRSSNVDKQLASEDLTKARFAEWCGYLVILCGSRAYLADSRQIFTHATGVAQYEWYMLDDLCSYTEHRECYRGTEALPYVLVNGEEVSLGDFAFADGAQLAAIGNGEDIDRDVETIYSGELRLSGKSPCVVQYVLRDGVAYYVEGTGEVQGLGEPAAACSLAAIEDVLYLGTEDGSLLCINTDKRGLPYDHGNGILSSVEEDQIYRLWYTHAGRRYISGFATSQDNCGYPHLLKSTVKKSCVLKMKTLSGGAFRAMSRTDRTEWRQIQRSGGTIEQVITASSRGFDDVDFGQTSYNGGGGITIPIMEKEKKWVEKQLYLYSDGFAQPFGIFGLAYRFTLSGRIKK